MCLCGKTQSTTPQPQPVNIRMRDQPSHNHPPRSSHGNQPPKKTREERQREAARDRRRAVGHPSSTAGQNAPQRPETRSGKPEKGKKHVRLDPSLPDKGKGKDLSTDRKESVYKEPVAKSAESIFWDIRMIDKNYWYLFKYDAGDNYNRIEGTLHTNGNLGISIVGAHTEWEDPGCGYHMLVALIKRVLHEIASNEKVKIKNVTAICTTLSSSEEEDGMEESFFQEYQTAYSFTKNEEDALLATSFGQVVSREFGFIRARFEEDFDEDMTANIIFEPEWS